MDEHFHLSPEVYSALLNSGITVKHFLDAICLFDPYDKGCEPSVWGFLYYLDIKGSHMKKPAFPHRKIASAVFDTFSTKEKMAIFDYIEYLEES